MDLIGDLVRFGWQIPILIGIFFLWAYVLYKLGISPVLRILEDRQKCEEEAKGAVLRHKDEADRREREMRKKMTTARKEASEIRTQARREAHEKRQKTLAVLGADLTDRLAKHEAGLRDEEEKARMALQSEVPSLAEMIATTLLKEAGN